MRYMVTKISKHQVLSSLRSSGWFGKILGASFLFFLLKGLLWIALLLVIVFQNMA